MEDSYYRHAPCYPSLHRTQTHSGIRTPDLKYPIRTLPLTSMKAYVIALQASGEEDFINNLHSMLNILVSISGTLQHLTVPRRGTCGIRDDHFGCMINLPCLFSLSLEQSLGYYPYVAGEKYWDACLSCISDREILCAESRIIICLWSESFPMAVLTQSSTCSSWSIMMIWISSGMPFLHSLANPGHYSCLCIDYCVVLFGVD